MSVQNIATVVQQPELLGRINQCLGTAINTWTDRSKNVKATCKELRDAHKRGSTELRIATRALGIPQVQSRLQREIADQLAAQILAGGAPGPGTP